MTYNRKNLSYYQKRDEVFKRDNWTCQVCGIQKKENSSEVSIYDCFEDNPLEREDNNDISTSFTVCKSCNSDLELKRALLIGNIQLLTRYNLDLELMGLIFKIIEEIRTLTHKKNKYKNKRTLQLIYHAIKEMKNLKSLKNTRLWN